MPSVAERVRHDLGWHGAADELTDDLPLIRAGALDSIGILTLVQFLESHYGILIDDDEIVSVHLGSLASIERLVQSKKSAVGGIQPAMTPNVSKLSRPSGRAGLPR
jgi:acyl carrier protein